MRPLYIFDLDGTLALIDHRVHLIQGERKNWDAFYEACDNDAPNFPVLRIMNQLAIFNDVWIFSGRSAAVRSKTVDWLMRYTTFAPSQLETTLMMRPIGDYTRDEDLKRSWLRNMIVQDRERLVAVFEDRDRMVGMWRSEGLTCLQVSEGGY